MIIIIIITIMIIIIVIMIIISISISISIINGYSRPKREPERAGPRGQIGNAARDWEPSFGERFARTQFQFAPIPIPVSPDPPSNLPRSQSLIPNPGNRGGGPLARSTGENTCYIPSLCSCHPLAVTNT